MLRRIASVAVLFAAIAVTGCGKSKTEIPDSEPPEVVEADPPVSPEPKVPDSNGQAVPAPKPPGKTIPPFAVYPQPKIETPPEPGPKLPMLDPQAPMGKLPPPPPEPKKPPEPKEKVSGSVKDIEWPTEIYGRTLEDYVEALSNPDPAERELALRMLPGFGPVVKQHEGATKGILIHMDYIKEGDPGVRAAAYEAAGHIGFEKDRDTDDAVRLLFNAADRGSLDGGPGRLHAVQTLSSFGRKAAPAIPRLIGGPSMDKAYETRRSVANALGRIAFDEVQGPNKDALACLVRLLDDHSAPVRLEAAQSLVLLGPPYLDRPKKAVPLKDVKGLPPPLDGPAITKYVGTMKKRLLPAKPNPSRPKEKPSPTGLVERDKQVEIYVRLAIMRIDIAEMKNDEHLDRMIMYIGGEETGPKLQALAALAMMGESGAKKIDAVVKVLSHPDTLVVNTAVSTLVAMGAGAAPAIPALKKLKDREPTSKDPKEQDEEKKYWAQLSDEAVKLIEEAGKKEAAPAPAPVEK